MKMFRFVIEGVEDTNRNGKPDIRVQAEMFGFPLLDQSVDISIKDAIALAMETAKKLRIIN